MSKTPLFLKRALANYKLIDSGIASTSIIENPMSPASPILSIQFNDSTLINISDDGRFSVRSHNNSWTGNDEHDIMLFTTPSLEIKQTLIDFFSDQIDGEIDYQEPFNGYLFALKDGRFVCAGTANGVLEAEIWNNADSFCDGIQDAIDVINIDGIDAHDYLSQEFLLEK